LILGLGTVIAARGLVHALATQVSVDQIAVTAASMLGLALGVDYSLLLVSRYREHRRADPTPVDANVETATRATRRTIVVAGILLIAVMASAAALAVGPFLSSAALGVVLATAFSVLSAIFVAPAILKELDPWLERWSIPRRRARSTPRWTRRQPIAIPLLAIVALLMLASPSLGLETGSPDVKLLPEGSPARVDYEKVAEAVGPGYGAVFSVLVQSRDARPLTADRSLAAITRVQRDLAADPGIAAVLGPAELNRVRRAAPRLERGLTGQSKGLARLDRGLTQAADGSRAAGDGAGGFHGATGDARRGSAALAKGIRSSERGSAKLAGGIRRVSSGSDRLVRGSDRVSTGAGKLSDQIDEARSGSASISNNAELLRNGLQTGSDQLRALHGPLAAAETSVAAVWKALEAMTVGRDDPQFQAAVDAARATSEALTGADPASGDQIDPGYAGVAEGIVDAGGQIDLGLYLANRVREQGDATRAGVTRLSEAARELDSGVAQVAAGNARLSEGLVELAESGAALPSGMSQLSRGADLLTEGLGKVEAGAGELAAGIGGSGAPGRLTGSLDRMQAAVAGQRRDAQGGELQERSPGLFDSGMLPLAIIDGAPRAVRERTQFVLDLSNSGRTAQITAFPAFETNDPRIDDVRRRVSEIAHRIDRPGLEVAVGGPGATFEDYEDAASARLGPMIAAFVLISLLILIVAVRAIPLAIVCVALNVLTIGVALGVMQLGFGSADPLLGGPGYVDILSLGVALAVVFALSIDYQTFLLARIREEYLASGSNDRALTAAIGSTAGVITGAAAVLVTIFLAFSISKYIGIREIGVGLAIAVFLDATVVRLVLLPAAMRAIGDRVWWFPRWLDRRLPNVSL
jgi:RND superfamily putative drug exporter